MKKESGYLVGVVEIGVGDDHSCALRNDGKVLCWGRGSNGRTGNGSVENALQATLVLDVSQVPGGSFLNGIVRINLGDEHSCALKKNGSTVCWGRKSNGRLGVPTTSSSFQAYYVLDENNFGSFSDILEVSAGGAHTCALKGNGKVFCWGSGDDGRLGNNESASYSYPQQVLRNSGAITIPLDLDQ